MRYIFLWDHPITHFSRASDGSIALFITNSYRQGYWWYLKRDSSYSQSPSQIVWGINNA